MAFRIRAGDAAAERELYLNFARALRYLVQRRCGDEQLAHDLVQECFRIALTHLRAGKLENPDTLAGFLRGIALNLVSTQQRAGWRERSTETDAELPGIEDVETPGPQEVASREQLRMLVRQLIAEMPVQRDRELLWRYYVLDEDKQLLCKALQLSPIHFDRVLHRARSRFRELASEHGLNTAADVP
ncbi:RNA polymerase sigma factor [Tahibacter aquaticus]|uniref:RNA polymerase sigma factor n=1 Tax=Tahibacter aquaticus TaxID=520092 RepID=UPI00141517D0|nr:sigma-70 family RNA polymerase sigma factor [Tahibacter aquaticus]